MYQIAIDGPSGAGKSTVAKALSRILGCIYVDTGAMYRTIGLYVYERGIAKNDAPAIIDCLKDIKIGIVYDDDMQKMFLNGRDVTPFIRTQEISMYASAVSAIPEVRSFLTDTQRDFAKENNVVMDGRDIGTVIFPNATVKIFLTSTPEARATRRYKELAARGENADYQVILAQTIERDSNDSSRAVAPALPAADAIIIDNSELDVQQTVDLIYGIVMEKIN